MKCANKTCKNCGQQFSRRTSKVCSWDCHVALKKQKAQLRYQSLFCTCCHAFCGIGLKKSSRLVGGVNTTTLKQIRLFFGVQTQIPEETNSLHNWVKTKVKQCKEPLVYPAREYLNDVKAKGWKYLDWSVLWQLEQEKTRMRERYRNLPPEEKKARNRAAWARRKSDPVKYEKFKEKLKQWKKTERGKAAARDYAKKNKKRFSDYKNTYRRRRQKKDPVFRAKNNLRKRFRELMRSVRGGGTPRISQLLGCSTKHLANHLESQFTKGMSWENYGVYWHVDHIIPVAAFDHKDSKQVAMCWHWTNLQPLRAEENIRKGCQLIYPQQQLLIAS